MTVTVGDGIAEQYKLYAALLNKPLEKVIAYALWDWMESVGQGHMEEFLKLQHGIEPKNLASPPEP